MVAVSFAILDKFGTFDPQCLYDLNFNVVAAAVVEVKEESALLIWHINQGSKRLGSDRRTTDCRSITGQWTRLCLLWTVDVSRVLLKILRLGLPHINYMLLKELNRNGESPFAHKMSTIHSFDKDAQQAIYEPLDHIDLKNASGQRNLWWQRMENTAIILDGVSIEQFSKFPPITELRRIPYMETRSCSSAQVAPSRNKPSRQNFSSH
ncbi:hypothetical protein Tco_0014772 [Tanacetum coccineum]